MFVGGRGWFVLTRRSTQMVNTSFDPPLLNVGGSGSSQHTVNTAPPGLIDFCGTSLAWARHGGHPTGFRSLRAWQRVRISHCTQPTRPAVPLRVQGVGCFVRSVAGHAVLGGDGLGGGLLLILSRSKVVTLPLMLPPVVNPSQAPAGCHLEAHRGGRRDFLVENAVSICSSSMSPEGGFPAK